MKRDTILTIIIGIIAITALAISIDTSLRVSELYSKIILIEETYSDLVIVLDDVLEQILSLIDLIREGNIIV